MKHFSLGSLIFPPRCAACRKRLDWYAAVREPTRALCSACERDWQSAMLETCGVCSHRVPECDCLTVEMKRARAVLHRKLVYYEHARRDAAQNRIIYTLKKTRSRRTYAWLAAQLCERLPEKLCGDAILTFVPRSPKTKHETGTDQAQELARALGRASRLSCCALLQRTRSGGHAQKSLSAEERRRNAAESYRLKRGAEKSVRGRTVVLIDDIVTTGNSMAACVRLLRTAGAACVVCMSVASDDYNAATAVSIKQKKAEIL